jgi:hypothetical protein
MYLEPFMLANFMLSAEIKALLLAVVMLSVVMLSAFTLLYLLRGKKSLNIKVHLKYVCIGQDETLRFILHH